MTDHMTTQPAMTVDLLPCPFCGGVAYADEIAEDCGDSAYWLSCQDCGREFNNPDTATGWYATREEAAASFNTRAAPSPPAGWRAIETAPLADEYGEAPDILGWNGVSRHVIRYAWMGQDGKPVFWNGDVQIGVTHWRELPPAPKSKG